MSLLILFQSLNLAAGIIFESDEMSLGDCQFMAYLKNRYFA